MKAFRFLMILTIAALCSVPSTAQTQQPTQEKTPGVDARQKVQKERIKEGMKSGELTKREARDLVREQKKIKRNETKAKADGDVTARERAKLQREQNRASKHIARQKHDQQNRK